MDGIYKYIGYAGKGHYGSTFKVKRKSDNKEIAIKIISNRNFFTPKKIKEEIEPLEILSSQCDNLFIVCYYNSYLYSNTFIIEMEYVDGYDMRNFINLKSRTNDEKYYYLLLLAVDISKGLKYIHENNIIHNDIKPENIIIDYNTSVPKIIDFGLSCLPSQMIKKGLQHCKSYGGTPYYIPLEKYTDGISYPKSDMWSLGITLYNLSTNKYPFDSAKTRDDIKRKLTNNNYKKLAITNNLLNVITNGLLKIDPTERLSSTNIIKQVNEKRLSYYRPSSLNDPIKLSPPSTNKNLELDNYIDFINNINNTEESIPLLL